MGRNTGPVSDTPWGDIDKSKLPYACHAPVGDPDKKETWHLPHHEGAGEVDAETGMYARSGALNRNGVHAAAGRFNQTDFASAADKRKAAKHLVAAYRYMDEEAPEVLTEASRGAGAERETSMDDTEMELELSPARVDPGGPPTDEQLALVNQFAPSPMKAEDVYVFPMTMSTDRLDSYGTHMDETSLRNFAADAQGGLPLMNSHRTGRFGAELPHGRIFWGEYAEDAGGRRTLEWAYMQRGLTLNGQANDDLIKAIDGGTVHDVSNQFAIRAPLAPRGMYRCDLCGNNLMSQACQHYPLMWYDENGNIVPPNTAGAKMATASIIEAHQAEGSLVWRGATPGAVIEKARSMAGQLPAEHVGMLEQAYGVRLMDAGAAVKPAPAADAPAAGDATTGGAQITGDAASARAAGLGTTLDEALDAAILMVRQHDPQVADLMAQRRDLEPLLMAFGFVVENARGAVKLADLVAQAREVDADLADEVEEAGNLDPVWGELHALYGLAARADQQAAAERMRLSDELDAARRTVEQMEKQAADGQAYREDLIRQAVEARVRAQGNAFDADGYRQTLERAAVDFIRSEIAAHEAAARELFAAGRPTRTPGASRKAQAAVRHPSAYQG